MLDDGAVSIDSLGNGVWMETGASEGVAKRVMVGAAPKGKRRTGKAYTVGTIRHSLARALSYAPHEAAGKQFCDSPKKGY